MRVVLINYEQMLLTDNFSDPHVIFDEGLFKLWTGNFSDDAIYYAESENGIDWSEPVPSLFPGGSKKNK